MKQILFFYLFLTFLSCKLKKENNCPNLKGVDFNIYSFVGNNKCVNLIKSDTLNTVAIIDFFFDLDFNEKIKNESCFNFDSIKSIDFVLIKKNQVETNLKNLLSLPNKKEKFTITVNRHHNFLLRLDCDNFMTQFTSLEDFKDKYNLRSKETSYINLLTPGLVFKIDFPSNLFTEKSCTIEIRIHSINRTIVKSKNFFFH